MDYAVINLAGHVVADLTEKHGKDGKEFAAFSIAVNQRYGGQDLASYYDCVVPGFMFQTMQKAGVSKGSALSITGKQTIRTYRTKEGHDGTSVNINVLDWRFEGPRPRNEAQPANTHDSAKQNKDGYGNIQPPVNLQDEDDLPL